MNKNLEYLKEIDRANENRSFTKAKFLKCNRCSTVQIVDDVKCPKCGSYDLEEVYLSAKELYDMTESGEIN